MPSLFPPVTGGNGALGVPREEEFPEAPAGGWDTVGSFIDPVTLKEFFQGAISLRPAMKDV